MKNFLLMLLGVLMTLPTFARDFTYTYEGQTLTYTVVSETDKTCMTKAGEAIDLNGYQTFKPGNVVTGDLVIPSKANDGENDFTVISIGDYAFYDCSGLTSITIPGSVTSIGTYAFLRCFGLEKAEFESIEALCRISFTDALSNPLFYAHHLYIDGEEITELVIPASVTSIGDNAFTGCSGLTSVVIPGSVTSIGYYAFEACKGLTSVVIPDSVNSIGNYAFADCSGLTSVTIPESVTSIGAYAFQYCCSLEKAEFESIEALCRISFTDHYSNPLYYAHHLYINGEEITELVIPGSVTSIGDYAFAGCNGLTSVVIPGSVTSIEDEAFRDCNSLEKAEFESIEALCRISFASKWANPLFYVHHLYINGEEITELVIPASVTSIGDYAFTGCRGLTSVVIPDSVNSIGNYAFADCSGLTSVTIPESVTSIGDYAFQHCNGLTSVTIPGSVNSIGNYVFEACHGLTSVVIPDSVNSIGNYAFARCSGLTSVVIPGSVTSIGDYAFSECIGLTSVTIPGSVTSIGDCAFQWCKSLTSVTISDGVTSIGNGAFYLCTALTSVTIPGSVTSIEDDAFSNCSALTSVTIFDGVSSIGIGAFYCCSGLTSVSIPGSVTSIGKEAFDWCIGLTSVYYGADNPIAAEANVFSTDTYEKATLYMSEKGAPIGGMMDPWKNFKNIEEYEFTGVEEIEADINPYKPYEVYDLKGAKVCDSTDVLTPGIYIVRQGNATKKVVIK